MKKETQIYLMLLKYMNLILRLIQIQTRQWGNLLDRATQLTFSGEDILNILIDCQMPLKWLILSLFRKCGQQHDQFNVVKKKKKKHYLKMSISII